MSPWLIGVALGFILNHFKGKKINLSKVFVTTGWIFSVTTIFLIIFGSYNMHQVTASPTVFASACFESLSRSSWAVSMSWIIFACQHGYGNAINWVLSLTQWQPLSRLSYCLYLVHMPIQMIFSASTKLPIYFNDINAVNFVYTFFDT